MVSQSTLSSGQGRRVPVERFWASRRHSALPFHSNLYFSKSLSMYSPHRESSLSISSLPSLTHSGNTERSLSRLVCSMFMESPSKLFICAISFILVKIKVCQHKCDTHSKTQCFHADNYLCRPRNRDNITISQCSKCHNTKV